MTALNDPGSSEDVHTCFDYDQKNIIIKKDGTVVIDGKPVEPTKIEDDGLKIAVRTSRNLNALRTGIGRNAATVLE